MKNQQTPRTLLEAVTYYSDNANCVEYIKKHYWPNGEVVCVRCGSTRISAVKNRPQFCCKDCKYQFSIRTNTIFENSPLPLSKWLATMWLMACAKNGISSHEIARSIGVCQKTAWFMSHRIREAMRTVSFKKLGGHVEVDETFIGGKDKNRHASKKQHKTGGADKIVVFGAVERGGRVTAKVMDSHKVAALQAAVLNAVDSSSHLYSDQAYAYQGMNKVFASHGVVNHEQGEYVNGINTTNSIESFWALFKRGLKGTHIHVSAQHLDRYLDDQGFRYDLRKSNDFGRFDTSVSQTVGRRLTWKQLTGRVAI